MIVEIKKDTALLLVIFSLVLFILSLFILMNCEDWAKAISAGGINCQDGDYGTQAIYMDHAKSSENLKLVVSFVCKGGKAEFTVRE